MKPYTPLPDEREIFAQLVRGNEAAFERIFHHYNQCIYPFIERMTKSGSIAEEIVQEVFLSVWLHREKLGDVTNYKSYIYTIAVNKTLNHLKKVANEKAMLQEIIGLVKNYNNSAEETINLHQSEALINQAVEMLPPQRKIIFQLSRNEGLSHQEIADRLHISKFTVKNQVVEALKFVRNYVSTHDEALLLLMLYMHLHKYSC